MSRISDRFNELKERNRIALVTYVTAGDPSPELTADLVLKLEESGADIVELGVPFSDPMADGPAIQLASERALKKGMTLKKVLETVKNIRAKSEIPIIIFGYYNPYFKYGLEKFAKDAAKAGADAVLAVDLPPEEAGEFKVHTDRAGLDFIFLLAPTSTSDRISMVAKNASGFVYLVSVTGITGVRPDMDYSLEDLTGEIRRAAKLPVGVGFGISSPEQVRRIARYADAVIVGSAIVRIIEKYGERKKELFDELSAFVSALSGACEGSAGRSQNRAY
jgi:tryptophan synthase alpha chain